MLFCYRVNDLDKALKALTATHIALHTQAQKKEADLEKTTFYVTTLQQDNDELQEVIPLVSAISIIQYLQL